MKHSYLNSTSLYTIHNQINTNSLVSYYVVVNSHLKREVGMNTYADDGNDVTDLKCKQDTIMMLHQLCIQLILPINTAAVN